MNRTLAGILETGANLDDSIRGVEKRGDVWFGGLHSPHRKCAKNKNFLFPNKNYWKIYIFENHQIYNF